MTANRFTRIAASLFLTLASIVLTVLGLVAADRVIGRWIADPRISAGLLFPPQMKLAVETYEYSYTIRTNSLGLRDDEYDIHERPKVLIAAIGDSFTFGQGVELEDTWVQRVERKLREKGLDVQILNLGQPGSSPPYYAQLAEDTLPILRPDLVLVGLLQSNDFEQVEGGEDAAQPDYRRAPALRTALRQWFPNLTNLAYRETAQQMAERETSSHGRWNLMQQRWKEDFAKLFAHIDDYDEGARYSFLALPTPVQDALRDGRLAPLLIYLCAEPLRAKGQRWRDLTVDSPVMRSCIDIVGRNLTQIEHVAEPYGGRTVVLALPQMFNADPYGRAVWKQMFGVLGRPDLDDPRADEAIRRAASQASLPSHEVTAAFREAARREPLFYPFDSHLNARGNEVYAELITPVIEKYVREIANR